MSASAPELKAITANRLRDGTVVFFDAAGRWVERLEDAALVADAEAERLLVQARRSEAGRVVVEAYVIAVTRTSAGLVPVKARELIRARGPSIRPDLGKQAAFA